MARLLPVISLSAALMFAAQAGDVVLENRMWSGQPPSLPSPPRSTSC